MVRRILQRALAASLLAVALASAAPAVTKVEPPNWWVGHTMNPVRVLIHGTGLTGASVHSVPALTTDSISINPAGTYLFVNVTIGANAPPGDYPIRIETPSGTATAPFHLDALATKGKAGGGFSPDDVIYLIMQDRFANGDASNDNPAISRGLFDRKNPHLYHGGDLQGVLDHLAYLKELGVTALWLTPVYDNTNHLGRDPFHPAVPIADYHGYGAIDYYGVEEHFGDLKLLRRLTESAHTLGIKVIQDQVANHVGPAHPWVADPPTPTWFHGTAARHLTETFNVWNLIDPHAADALIRPVLDGWFADTLPDLNQSDPEVARYEIQNALWWIEAAGFDGIRQDTLPYVPRSFWAEWSASLKRQYPAIRTVGEVLDGNPALTSFFQAGVSDGKHVDTGIDTLFDYPVYFALRDAFARGKNLDGLIKMLANDRVYPNPAALVTIFGDHDVSRFMSEPGVTVAGLKLALTFVLTARGTPVIYYGDEIGMQGGDDPDNRRDFPGGWAGDPHNAFDPRGRTGDEADIFEFTKKLTALRARLEPLRRGDMISLAESSQAWVYARNTDAGAVLVALNNDAKPTVLNIQMPGEDRTFRSLLGTTSDLKIQNGSATIQLPGRAADIFSADGGAH